MQRNRSIQRFTLTKFKFKAMANPKGFNKCYEAHYTIFLSLFNFKKAYVK